MSKDLIRRISLSRNVSMIQKGPQYLKHLSKKDIFEGHLSHLRHLTELFVWFFSQLPVVTMAAFSSFWPSFPFLTFLLPRPFELASLVFFVILVRRFLLMLFSHNRRMSRISQIKRLTRQITDRQEGKRKQKWSQIAPRSSMPQFVAWPTDWFPGPPRAIAYLCTTRATLTALQTEDIWPIFCFSCPFMSFEAQRKSQYAKLIQFFVANFRLWSRCRHFLIEWPSFVAISFGRCRYFFAHVACRNLPWQGLKRLTV